MAEPINLNRARKARDKARDAAAAAQNRIRFGRTRSERQAQEDAEALARRRLDAHRRDDEG